MGGKVEGKGLVGPPGGWRWGGARGAGRVVWDDRVSFGEQCGGGRLEALEVEGSNERWSRYSENVRPIDLNPMGKRRFLQNFARSITHVGDRHTPKRMAQCCTKE